MASEVENIAKYTKVSMALCHVIESEKGILEHPDYVVLDGEDVLKKDFFTYNGGLPAIAMFSDLLWLKCVNQDVFNNCGFMGIPSMCGFIMENMKDTHKTPWVYRILQVREALSGMCKSNGVALDFTPGIHAARDIGSVFCGSFNSYDVHKAVDAAVISAVSQRMDLHEGGDYGIAR